MALGRPRSFDLDKALDQALNVFWRKGFEGASLPDLTKAMGINRPSLYAAFGNKEALFRKAVQRYEEQHACRIRSALDEPRIHDAIEKLLRGNIELFTRAGNPPGCFMVQGALACGDDAEKLKCELNDRRAKFMAQLRQRFVAAIAAGELPADADGSDLAHYFASVSHGLAVQAAGGATRAQLMRVVKLSLAALPKRRKK